MPGENLESRREISPWKTLKFVVFSHESVEAYRPGFSLPPLLISESISAIKLENSPLYSREDQMRACSEQTAFSSLLTGSFFSLTSISVVKLLIRGTGSERKRRALCPVSGGGEVSGEHQALLFLTCSRAAVVVLRSVLQTHTTS